MRKLVKDTNLELTDEYLKLIDEINEFNIRARYDDFKFAFYKKATKEFTKGYLNKSKDLHQWLKKQL